MAKIKGTKLKGAKIKKGAKFEGTRVITKFTGAIQSCHLNLHIEIGTLQGQDYIADFFSGLYHMVLIARKFFSMH